MRSDFPGIKLVPVIRRLEEKKNTNSPHALTSSIQLKNRSFHVVERTRTAAECTKMKNARAKRAKVIVKYANTYCLSSRFAVLTTTSGNDTKSVIFRLYFTDGICSFVVANFVNSI